MSDIDQLKRNLQRARAEYQAGLKAEAEKSKAVTAGQYEPGSEQFLAAVWYVMKYVTKRYRETRKGQTIGKWAVLNHVLRQLNLQSMTVGYPQMREELADFAETFGVVGATSPVARRANSEARREFQ
jgi:hypothetical protein